MVYSREKMVHSREKAAGCSHCFRSFTKGPQAPVKVFKTSSCKVLFLKMITKSNSFRLDGAKSQKKNKAKKKKKKKKTAQMQMMRKLLASYRQRCNNIYNKFDWVCICKTSKLFVFVFVKLANLNISHLASYC